MAQPGGPSEGEPALKRVRTEGAAAGAKTVGDELCEKLARKEPGALAALSTWVGLNPQGFIASVREFPASRLLDEAVPLAAACAREQGPRGLEDLFILVEALIRGGYATPEEYDGEKNRAARDAILSGDVVALLVEEAATFVVKAFETASRHNERCLAILAQYLRGAEWQRNGVTKGVELRLQPITSRLDVFQFCKLWDPIMHELPAEEGRLLLEHHASVCLVICSSPSFTTDVLIAKDMPQLLLNMPCRRGLGPHNAAACKLLERVVDECSRGSPWSRAAAIRAGMFQIAWRTLVATSPSILHMAHKLLAWCYPMTASSEADTLRRILKTETSALAWCKDFQKAFGWSQDDIEYGLHTSNYLLSERHYLRHFRSEFKRKYNKKLFKDGPCLWSRQALFEDIITTFMNRRAAVPECLSMFSMSLSGALSYEVKKLENESESESESESGDAEMGSTAKRLLASVQEKHRAARKESIWVQFQSGGRFRFILTDYPELVDFRAKSCYLQHVLSTICDEREDDDPIVLAVPRESVTEGVCRRLGLAEDGEPEMSVAPRGLLMVEFKGEAGQDQGGLRRAWLELAAGHFVRSDLFVAPQEDATHLSSHGPRADGRRLSGRRWSPAPLRICKVVQNDWDQQFILLGSIMAFALLYGEQMPVKFCTNFLRLVVHGSLDGGRASHEADADLERLLAELHAVDTTLAQKVKYLSSGNYSVFGAGNLSEALNASGLPGTFVAEDSRAIELTGTTELKSGGRACCVDESNKIEFLRHFAAYHLSGSIIEQAALVRKGLMRVLCPGSSVAEGEAWFMLTSCFTAEDVELLIAGEEAVDVAAWKKSTSLEGGFSITSSTVLWFWEIIEGFDAAERAQLLAFARGSSALPPDGFAELNFIIRKVAGNSDRLPEAHTCEFSLDLPEYSSKEELEAKLRRAMEEETFGRI